MLDKNLTGEQIQTILDLYLYRALGELLVSTSLFDQQISYLLSITTRNRKRKVSSVDRNIAISCLCKALAVSDPVEKLAQIKQARIERWFIHVFIAKLLKELYPFVSLYEKALVCTNKLERKSLERRVRVIADSIGSKNVERLYVSVRNAKVYMDKFYAYRENVVQHYLKHSSKQANMYVKSKGGAGYVYEDVRQTIIKSVLLAIDKYDSSKGALTSYVNWWIWNAQTCAAPEHEYGIAYTIPQTQRKKLAEGKAHSTNYSVSLDTLTTDEDEGDNASLHDYLDDGTDILQEIEDSRKADLIRYLVKCADPTGVVRLSLDIEEVFSKKELSRMRRITQETKQKLKLDKCK